MRDAVHLSLVQFDDVVLTQLAAAKAQCNAARAEHLQEVYRQAHARVEANATADGDGQRQLAAWLDAEAAGYRDA